MTTGTTIAEQPERIDHSEQIERMLDAYDRPLTSELDRHVVDFSTRSHLRGLVRQAIEQAWDAGHACQQQHAPALATDVPAAQRVSDDRVGEILAGLNSFVVYELEPHTEIIDGVSVLKREIVGADFNLDKAVDWALDLPEVSSTCGPDRGTADVELVDGTVLEFIPSEKSWSVTVSDDAEAVSA